MVHAGIICASPVSPAHQTWCQLWGWPNHIFTMAKNLEGGAWKKRASQTSSTLCSMPHWLLLAKNIQISDPENGTLGNEGGFDHKGKSIHGIRATVTLIVPILILFANIVELCLCYAVSSLQVPLSCVMFCLPRFFFVVSFSWLRSRLLH